MDRGAQSAKAEIFLALHHDPKLLILPNIWDPLGARILAAQGYPAVATASAAVAYSMAYDDGQQVSFSAMLHVVHAIATSVDVPLTADIERGYAEDVETLTDNLRRVIRAGAVGVNLEDSLHEGGALRAIDAQCERIRAARRAGELEGVPLVINARVDTFLRESTKPLRERVDETLLRATAYLEAGADCIYPIGPGDLETLTGLRERIHAPINVYAHAGTASIGELEAAGISRLSLGPNLLRATYARVRDVGRALLGRQGYEAFTTHAISGEEMNGYIRRHSR
jgi:2-methylisocitrate lyase-like PEP mutase family enzyme